MKTRPFPPVYQSLSPALQEIFGVGGGNPRYADKVIEKSTRSHKKWGGRDRRQFAEAIYDIVRWWRRLLTENHLDGEVVTAQVVEKIVNYYYSTFDVNSNAQGLSRAQKESIPDWLDQLGENELGKAWSKIIQDLNVPSVAYLRANTLRATAFELKDKLERENISVDLEPDLPSALRLLRRANVFQTEAYKAGLFEMQDGASQMVAPLLNPQPGERIADVCAGAGGKTLHIAALMKNRGRIVAMDIHQWKLDELKTRARRAGVSIIDCRPVTSTKIIKRLEGQFDRVLIDVPCTGLGVLRRKPDTKWKLTMDEVKRLHQLQEQILDRYCTLVKPGGALVYATCSVLPSENKMQVESFCSRNKNFKFEKDIQVMPNPYDGFFAALLWRAN